MGRRPMNLRITRPLACALALASPPLAAQIPAPTAAPTVEHDLWISAATAADGTALGAPLPSFEVSLGEGPSNPAAATPAGPAPRVVLYFDLDLLTESARRGSAVFLGSQARQLAALGAVEIVLSGEEGLRHLPFAGSGAEAVNAALEGFVLRQTGGDRLGRLREDFHRASLPDPRGAAQSAAAAVDEEVRVVRSARERLVLFAADVGVQPGAVLLLVTGAAEEDPRAFYRQTLEAQRVTATELDALPRPVVLPSLDEVGRILATHGWTLLTLDPGRAGGGALLETAPAVDEEPELELQNPLPGNPGDPERGRSMVGFKLGGADEEPEEPVFDPRLGDAKAWRVVSEATGGEFFGGQPLGLGATLDRLAARVKVHFAAPKLGAGAVQPVRVSGPASITVRAPHWLGRAPLESVSAVRVRQLLGGEELDGEVALEASLELVGPRVGRLAVRIPRESQVALDAASARWTIGIAGAEGEPLVFTRPATPTTEPGLALFDLTVPDGAATRLVVLGEDLETGRFGLTYATFVEPGAGLDLTEAPTGPRVVRFEPLVRPFVFGPTAFGLQVSSPDVKRVEFLLDGELAGVRTAPPWVLSIDLGEVPRRRDLEAVAKDAQGAELGRDWLRINEGSGAFRVRIVEPRAVGLGQVRVGPVDVAAEVVTPEGSALARVEFYWNATLVATRYQAPWRQRVVVPESEPGGFLRVVAHLVDGTSTEDVLFPNAAGSGERIDVELVEVYVAVSDRQGQAAQSLGEKDFRVFEEGSVQEIASFAQTVDLPVTVGLALDSSASMFVKLPIVGRAAGTFVERFLRPRDRAFVVGFGGSPQLVQATSPDGEALVAAIERLTPDGQTAIWEGIVYSLVQLQGATGQKALVVYTDGADEDDTFAYETALRFARRVGVPVYIILANNEIVRTEGRALGVRRFVSRVRRLAESVGGRIYLANYDDDLGKIYEEIGRDLRSQYLLTFYPRSGAKGWRRLKVVVPEGYEARAAAGYFR